MDYVNMIGIRTKSAANYIQSWGSKILIPTLIRSGYLNTVDELKGTQEFVELLSKIGIPISVPSEVWKYATFISYIADSRDISVIDIGNIPIIPTGHLFSLKTNILQSANFTIATFSGECSAFARLYSATQLVLGNHETYSAYILGQKSGHATNIYQYQQKWFVEDYYRLLSGGNPWQLLTYLWSVIYKNGWASPYTITIVKNIYYVSGKSEKSYLQPIASDSLADLLGNGTVKTTWQPEEVNFTTSPDWKDIQAKAYSYFNITKYSQEPALSNLLTNKNILLISIAILALFLISKGG